MKTLGLDQWLRTGNILGYDEKSFMLETTAQEILFVFWWQADQWIILALQNTSQQEESCAGGAREQLTQGVCTTRVLGRNGWCVKWLLWQFV